MSTITIPKKEYQDLLEKKMRYERLRQALEEDIFTPPPTKNKKAILWAFKAEKRYNSKFIQSLKRGLERSSYFRA